MMRVAEVLRVLALDKICVYWHMSAPRPSDSPCLPGATATPPAAIQWSAKNPRMKVPMNLPPAGALLCSVVAAISLSLNSGTWKGGRGGGMLYGVITNDTE